MKKIFFIYLLSCSAIFSFAQYKSSLSEKDWVDSVANSLSKEEKIAQLMVIRAHSNLGDDHVAQVSELVSKYNVGALCFFQGGPVRQANLTNLYQSLAKTPLMITIDGEFGLGMRLDSVTKFPYQSTLGAITDETIIYKMGFAVGEQMKRIGVHVNYAPTVDVNNNPNNPVIGYRSFGEDKYKVARFGVNYMRGMQDAGIMATAKHFPGHGDTDVDSHLDLPVISKSMRELDSLELYPFKEMIKAGVGGVMVAHLYVPAIDKTANRSTSLSKKAITDLLQKKYDFKGLVFTDALEMKGITKFFPAGEAAVEALIAGNDMLCLPENVPAAIDAIKTAIEKDKLKWKDIDEKLEKVLKAKYRLGLNKTQYVETANLVEDLNKNTDDIRSLVARNSLTVLHNQNNFFPFQRKDANKKIAYVGIGSPELSIFGERLQKDFGADVFNFSYQDKDDSADRIIEQVKNGGYSSIIFSISNYNLRPANNFYISPSAIRLWNGLQSDSTATFLFGNVYAAKNFCDAKNLVAAYQDDDITQEVSADFLLGRFPANGKLPVTVCNFNYGSGIAVNNLHTVGTNVAWLKIDSIVRDGLARRAFPGCIVLAIQNGEVKYHKAFGHFEFSSASNMVNLRSIYDLASVTKISATTVAIMKLYEEGRLSLEKTLGDYLPVAVGTNKADLTIRDILLHQAGLVASISFYRETIDPSGNPSNAFYNASYKSNFTIPVAENLFLRKDWNDTMLLRIMQSPLGKKGRYVYSDNDFILLGKIVEAISGMPLDQYVQKTFYKPLGMTNTSFKAWERFGVERIVPTEQEKYFRKQLLRGYVHDEGAALFGNVSGHAGLFSNAYDLSLLYQMLLNGGELGGRRFFKPETIKLFTAYSSDISRRGLGFDKPEKDNTSRDEPYPSAMASPETFGHTGFTGTCVWADPQKDLVYIFLSNRVYNTRDNNLLSRLNIRSKIQDAIYSALEKEKAEIPREEIEEQQQVTDSTVYEK
jgi:beta-glucosidase-like glycosyl hydrolase/CubicO group peptidase (beta-lactamase class C family)